MKFCEAQDGKQVLTYSDMALTSLGYYNLHFRDTSGYYKQISRMWHEITVKEADLSPTPICSVKYNVVDNLLLNQLTSISVTIDSGPIQPCVGKFLIATITNGNCNTTPLPIFPIL